MAWDKIAIMIPTYGRSKTLLPVFIRTCLETVSNPDVLRWAFCVNENDKETQTFLETHSGLKKEHVTIVKENLPRPNLAVYFNMLYDAAKKYGDECLVTMLGDDMEFRTKDWDVSILAMVNHYKGIGVFWVNDDYIAKERCAVNLFVTRKMIEESEHKFMAEEFAGDVIDWIWTRVGRYTKSSHYLPDVHIFHNTRNRAEYWDETFKRLVPSQQEAHRIGKDRAREVAKEIADVLNKKGFTGDSIC